MWASWIPRPRIYFMEADKRHWKLFPIISHHLISLCRAMICLCVRMCVCALVCEWVWSDLRDFSVHPDLCFFLSFISPVAPASPYCVCVCCVPILSVHTGLGWDARLITADGCYEISLHSSFVPVGPILLCSPPASLSFSRLSLCALICLSALGWFALIYLSVLDDAYSWREGQSISGGSYVNAD